MSQLKSSDSVRVASASHSSLPLSRSRLLQRRCACGNHAMSGDCAECSNEKQTLQRAALAPHGRRSKGEGEVPPIVHDVLHSPGQPLDVAIRAFMEPRFGHDFSWVRVHTDTAAAESARAVHALAYTVGRDVVFGVGQYAPFTHAGQKLIAHEMTHVLQQRDATSGSPLSSSVQLGPREDASEREAQAAADLVISSERLPVSRIGQKEQRISRQIEEEGLERREPTTRQPGEPLPYREAMEATERGLFDE